MDDFAEAESRTRQCRFKSEAGEATGGTITLPVECTVQELTSICNAILQQTEHVPYLFYIDDQEVTRSLGETLESVQDLGPDAVVDIVYQQQAVFRVRPITRCTSSMPGHAEAVISVGFSPDGKHLASGSGDTTVRLWDLHTQCPLFVCKGHKNWVLSVAWSPNSSRLASGCKNGMIIIWDPSTGQSIGKPLQGHKKWITALTWEPYHSNTECRMLASSSKDGDIRIWDTVSCVTHLIISGHTATVSAVKWGGGGLIYSASHDRTVKVWRAKDGILCRTLEGHAHWVNTLTLNTDYILRIGPFDPVKGTMQDETFARSRYDSVIQTSGGERLVSGSDDFTLFLWNPEKDKKPLARLTGHQNVINDVKFSPDGRILASASFDKSIKLWKGTDGAFIGTLRGHVQAVYMVSFSADSRLLVSGSADSTLKLWDLKTGKLQIDLPGHADEVYAVDWATDGLKVASGGKDKVLKLWHN